VTVLSLAHVTIHHEGGTAYGAVTARGRHLPIKAGDVIELEDVGKARILVVLHSGNGWTKYTTAIFEWA
jgi:hypothetical protein